MRVVHISTTPAGAAYRLHAGLRRLGVDSSMLVAEGRGDAHDPTISLFHAPRALPNRLRRRLVRTRIARAAARYQSTRPAEAGYFFDDRSPHGGDLLPQIPPCDVIHLHTMIGLVDFGAFFRAVPARTPVVRTLHDMSFFTGGCHQDWGCGKFRTQCGACPQLGSHDADDLSRQIWRRKYAALSAIPPNRFHLVTPSQWMAGMAKASPLLRDFPVTVIPLALDSATFRPRDRACARDVLEIPADAGVVLVVASPIARTEKGFALLAQALNAIARPSNVFLVSVGRGEPPGRVDVPHRHLGYVESEAFLSLVYSAADVVVLPSIQDTFPQAGIEALACGVPLVGFAVGGIPEIVRPGVTGTLVPPRDVAGLGAAIVALLQDPAWRARLAANCRRIAADEYALDIQARRHASLYEQMLARAGETSTAGRRAEPIEETGESHARGVRAGTDRDTVHRRMPANLLATGQERSGGRDA